MSNIKKIFLMLILSVLCFSTNVSAIYIPNGYKIQSYVIEATIKNNGSIDVAEYLIYYFNGSMDGVHRDILYNHEFSGQKNDMKATSNRYQASGIGNVNVYTSDISFNDMNKSNEQSQDITSKGMNNIYTISNIIENGYTKKINVYSPVSSSEHKYVKYEYTIENAIVNYNDYSEFYWDFVGSHSQCDINKLNIYVYFPTSGDIHAFGHTFANLKEFTILDNEVDMKVSNIPAGMGVDIRAVFPNTSMPYVSKNISQNYDFNMLTNLENQEIKKLENFHLSNKIWFFYVGMNILMFIYLIRRAIKFKSRKIKEYKNIEYHTDLPDTYSLSEYSCIINKIFGYMDFNLILATIMDLSNRKYIKLEPFKKEKIFNKTYKCYVSVDEMKDLNELNDYEKGLLNYIFNKKVDSNINMTEFIDNRFELNEKFKELKKYHKLYSKYDISCLKKAAVNYTKMYAPIKNKLLKTLPYLFAISLIVEFVNTLVISPLPSEIEITNLTLTTLLVVFSFIGVAAIMMMISKSLTDEYADEYNKLLGFKKYLKEYSAIKEKYPIENINLEKHLVFAALFGISSEVAEEFKVELLKQGYDENYIYTNYPTIYIGIYTDEFISSVIALAGSKYGNFSEYRNKE